MGWKRFVWEKRISIQGKTLQYLDLLRKWQWLDEREIQKLQQQRILALLSHAYQHIPYYRNMMLESGVAEEDGTIHMDRFHQLPLLPRERLQTHFEELKSDDLHQRKWYEKSSGGSTGVPVTFIQDKEYFAWNQAIKALDDEWSSRGLVDRQVRLWGSERDLMVGKETKRVLLGRWLRNERWLNSMKMTPERMRQYVDQINFFKPVQILAYVESIYELARFCEQEKLKVHIPKAIMTSAGTLSLEMRDTIERVFQTKVFNRYGSRELGDIACECERHHGLHVSALTHYIEVLKPDGTPAKPGEVGEIVATLLVNYAMPFIRYRIGDMGVWSENPCDCGRGLPLLREVTGRVTDVFIDKRGKWIDGRGIAQLLFRHPFIRKFQVIQEQKDLIRVLIVPMQNHVDAVKSLEPKIDSITHDIQKIMECHVRFEYCEDIPPSPSGKYRYLLSHVNR